MIKHIIGVFIIGIIVLLAIIYGFTISGGPFSVRQEKFDAQRINDLTNAKYAIENYYTSKKTLPKTISEAFALNNYSRADKFQDPETKKEYEYSPGIDNSYKLCAVFSTATNKKSSPEKNAYTSDPNYKHSAGRYCFDFQVVKPETAPGISDDRKYDSNFLCMYLIDRKQYTKIGQTVKTGTDQVVTGIKVKIEFTTGKGGLVTVREISDEKNPESGTLVTKAEIKANFDGTMDNSIYFPKPITLSKDKAYIFIFESDQESTMYVYYSDYNAAPTATTFMYTYNVTSSINEEFTWVKYPLSDIYYYLL